MVEHVQRLLDDDRLRLDTTRGRRPAVAFTRTVTCDDRGVELKRLMLEMGLPDRELEASMPVGRSVEAVLSRRRWLVFQQTVGRMVLLCLSPTRQLLQGQSPPAATMRQVQQRLAEMLPARSHAPTTVVVMSTSGFEPEVRELVERTADRTVVLVEPNDQGGWTVHGPNQTLGLAELLDPEAEEDKRRRIRQAIERDLADLSTGGIGAERLAARTGLPVQLVERELQAYAKETAGLAARRLRGQLVLFREGSVVQATGAKDMPFMDRIRSLFERKGDNERKIAALSERRAELSQQRDRAYEELATLEGRDAELRQQFRTAGTSLAKRRITSQLLQLRKDMERRQQLIAVLNQQVNVVSTHLHNLELLQQGQSAQLPDAEELAKEAAAAEELLERLGADSELAQSVSSAAAGMSAEEQALYEELEREAATAGAPAASQEELRVAEAPAAQRAAPPPLPDVRKRPEAEPG